MNKKNNKNNKGFTLVEAVLYCGMLTLLTGVVISSLFMFRSYNVMKVNRDIETSAIQIIDKLTRDIRDANSIVQSSSSFSVPEGSLGLTILTGTTTDTYKYYSTSTVFKMEKNGVYLGTLSQSGVIVNNFTVRQISGTSTKAVKIELNLQETALPTVLISKNFYTTVQLRN